MGGNYNVLFIKVYLSHANRVISSYVADERTDKIRRAKIEMQILEEIEKSMFPMDLRIDWVSMVVHSNTFDIYWLGQQDLHNLHKDAIKRIEPDMSLAETLISPSPSASPSSSSSSSRESSPLNSGLGFPSLSNLETSSEIDAPILKSQTPDAPAVTPTKPTKKRATKTGGKQPAGVRKSRAPAKKKLSPAAEGESKKLADIVKPDEQKSDIPIDKEEPAEFADESSPSPLQERFKTPETSTPAGVLKNSQIASKKGKGEKQKSVRFNLLDE
ncbi:hypothetical protein I7I48_06526 [Histoplasma ohiense]|nr:hypothetical protein I7I48_06526 [Histoplasma ohiense (nom. inval.)]